jgi:zinc and cadmium transporter
MTRQHDLAVASGWTMLSCFIICTESLIALVLWKTKLLEKCLSEIIALNIGTLLGVCFIELQYDIGTAMLIDKSLTHIGVSTLYLLGVLVPFCIEKFIKRGQANKLVFLKRYIQDQKDKDVRKSIEVLPSNAANVEEVSQVINTTLKTKANKSLIVIALLGDMLHNFVDGSIIASAYLISPGTGLATTISTFMEEMPHLAGTFAVFVIAGTPLWKAVLLNILGAFPFLLGGGVILIIVASTPKITTDQIAYLLPFAVGSFLYVVLADLTPILTSDWKGWPRAVSCLASVGFGIFIQAMVNYYDYKMGT